MPSLAELNTMQEAEFVDTLGGIIEHSPWVPAAIAGARPFGIVSDLHAALVAVLKASPEEKRLAVLRAHPMLAGLEARSGALTRSSTDEQDSAGLRDLDGDELRRFDALNHAYLEKFGFPFIVAVKAQKGRRSILDLMAARLERDRETEFRTALDEVTKIARFRLGDLTRREPA